MKPRRPQFEVIEVPKLDPEIKAMNGRSGREVAKKIDDLCEHLEDKDEKSSTGDSTTAE